MIFVLSSKWILFFHAAREFEIVFLLKNQIKTNITYGTLELIHQTLRRFDIYVKENQLKEIGALENELGTAAKFNEELSTQDIE